MVVIHPARLIQFLLLPLFENAITSVWIGRTPLDFERFRKSGDVRIRTVPLNNPNFERKELKRGRMKVTPEFEEKMGKEEIASTAGMYTV